MGSALTSWQRAPTAQFEMYDLFRYNRGRALGRITNTGPRDYFSYQWWHYGPYRLHQADRTAATSRIGPTSVCPDSIAAGPYILGAPARIGAHRYRPRDHRSST